MKTLSEILIEADKNPTPRNKLSAWEKLIENKKKYPLVQLQFAKEYLDIQEVTGTRKPFEQGSEFIITNLGREIIVPRYEGNIQMGVTGIKASEAAKKLRKAIESCILNNTKDSMMVKIVKKLNRILNWFYKNIKIL